MFSSPKLSTALALGWSIFILVAFSNAGTDMFVAVAVLGAIVLWGLALLIRALLWLISRSSPKNTTQSKSISAWGWAIEAFAIVSSIGLINWQIPLMLRIKLSEPHLVAYIRSIDRDKLTRRSTNYPSRRVGLFQLRETEPLDNGVVRFITAKDFIDDAGFVYSPNRQPPIKGEDSYRHLYGDWWYWHRSW
jgi:hypothetical protein